MPRTRTAASCRAPGGWCATGRRTAATANRERSDPSLRSVRVDDGVADGGEVSMFYDPMIAKLITWAPTRDEAIDAQVDALDQFVIDGICRQCRFPLGADAAPALPRGRDHDRLHRRGISRRLRRRARRRAADRRPRGHRRHGRGHHRRARGGDQTASSGPPPHFPCERVVGIAAASSTRCGSSPTRAARWR